MINQEYHFDITPHIVKQLGEQLVSDEITALLELIKNSFDADATYVSIEINTTGQYTKETSNPQLSSSASFLRLNVLSSLN